MPYGSGRNRNLPRTKRRIGRVAPAGPPNDAWIDVLLLRSVAEDPNTLLPRVPGNVGASEAA